MGPQVGLFFSLSDTMDKVVHHTPVILEVRQPLTMLLWGAHVVTEGTEG